MTLVIPLQLKLGYRMKAGHRAFRRLRLALEASGCVKEVIGKVDDKPVVCIRWTTPGEANIYIPCNKMPKATLAFLSTCFCCYCFAVSHTQSQPVDSAYVDLAVRQAQAAQGAGVGAGGGRRRRCRRGDETLAALFAFQCVQVPACSSGSGQSHIGRLLHTDERFPAGNLFTVEIKQLCVNQDDEEDVGENVLIAERTVDRQILDAIIDAGAALPKTYQEICWDSCCKSKLCKEQVEPSDRP